LEIITISSDFRITIPKSIRDTLKIKPGDEFLIYGKEDTIIMVRKKAISDLRGKFKGITDDNLRDEFDRKL
jgi:AbrB family looped-hinge helix DNA binding protein